MFLSYFFSPANPFIEPNKQLQAAILELRADLKLLESPDSKTKRYYKQKIRDLNTQCETLDRMKQGQCINQKEYEKLCANELLKNFTCVKQYSNVIPALHTTNISVGFFIDNKSNRTIHNELKRKDFFEENSDRAESYRNAILMDRKEYRAYVSNKYF